VASLAPVDLDLISRWRQAIDPLAPAHIHSVGCGGCGLAAGASKISRLGRWRAARMVPARGVWSGEMSVRRWVNYWWRISGAP